jgi:solute:Na+ symporter, SSS family
MSALDYAVVVAYLAAVAAIGFAATRSKNTYDYFLGGRGIPWWAAGLSVVATETSALTLIGAPIQSLRGDWTYLQLAFGSALGRLIVAQVLLPTYYRAGVYTVYDYLAERFGPATRDAGSVLFFVGRTLGSGVRLYAAAIALVLVLDISFPLAMSLIGIVAVAYTVSGGIRSVIWTDVLQASLFLAGGGLALWYLLGQAGGAAHVYETLAAGQTATGTPKLRLLDWSLDPATAYTVLAGLVGSAFLTMATHGTDQDMIQRCFTCSDERGARRSMVVSAVVTIPLAALFLSVGSVLWVRYGGDAGAAAVAAEIAAQEGLRTPAQGFDFIFPHYVISELPAGVRGAIIASILAGSMGSLDSAISALASTGVKNVWEVYFRRGRDEAHLLRVSRWMSIGFGVAIVGVAVWVWFAEETGGAQSGFGVLMLGLKVLSWVFPPLLGIFLVGVLTQRGRDLGNLVALAVGVGVLLGVEQWPGWFGTPAPFAWTWNALVGCSVAFGVAVLFPAPVRAPQAALARAAT